ncbi:MAG TPA: methyltransferase [Candidatus Binataceae bacterium]|nr:methyltransferase [Candidatus Binataceae bacterium]
METQNTPIAEPPGLALYRIGVGHYFSRALALAAKLGIADHLKDGPRHYEDVARATATNAPSLNRVMRLLASIGIFEERAGGIFALTPIGELLRTDVPGSMRSMVQLFAGVNIQDSWKELEYCVQTGEPAFCKNSQYADAFEAMAANPEQAKVFDEAMATFAPMTAMAIAASYDFSPFRRLVDVGGGNGALLTGILGANPHLHGTLFDLSHAVEKARAKITEAGLESRCDAVAGDFFKEVPPGADAYIIKHVIHDWNDERATVILRNIRRTMPPHGKLLIAEGVYPERVDTSDAARGAAGNDVNMLVCTGGRQRSEAEFRSLYAAAGFKFTKIIPTPARLSIIEADPV